MTRAPVLALAALLTSSCGAALMKLPQGPGTAAGDTKQVLSEATAACSAVSSISAEAAVSGSVGGQRVRVRLNAGLVAPEKAGGAGSARVEALALGQPLFVFVARAQDASLLLQQDNRVLEHGPPDDILEAVTGVPVGPDSLLTLLTGCTPWASDNAGDAAAIAEDWRIVRNHYFRRSGPKGAWQLVAVRHMDSAGGNEWRAEFRNFVRGLPNDIRIRSMDGKRFDLHLSLSQVALNETFDDRAFRIQIPPAAVPITLQELRDSGPLSGAQGR